MGTLVPLERRTQLALKAEKLPPKARRELDLVLDDTRLRGMASPERQAVLRAMARLMLEASGLAMREVGND